MCHSNNVVIYTVVFGPERITYSVKESCLLKLFTID